MGKSDPTDSDKGKRKNKQTKEDMKAEKKDSSKICTVSQPSACAKHFEVCAKTLRNLVKDGRDYIGGGRKTGEQENKLTEFVSERLSLGCGRDFHQLCLTIQDLIWRLRVADPDREFSDWDSDYPASLAEDHGSQQRQEMLTTADLDNCFFDVNKKFFTDPKFSACFEDLKRTCIIGSLVKDRNIQEEFSNN